MLDKLRRSPRYFWTFVAGIAIVCGALVQGYVNHASNTLHQFGNEEKIYILNNDVNAGQTLQSNDISIRDTPHAFIPSNALRKSPTGKTALVDLKRGEMVIASRVAPDGLQGAAALLTPGRRALAVPKSIGTPDLHVSDSVDVLLTVATSDNEQPTLTVAQKAIVVALTDDAVTVSVLPEEAEKISFGLANGTVALVLTPRV